MNEIHSSNSLLTVVHKQAYMHQELPVFHSIDHSNQNNLVDHHKLVILLYCLYHIVIIDSIINSSTWHIPCSQLPYEEILPLQDFPGDVVGNFDWRPHNKCRPRVLLPYRWCYHTRSNWTKQDGWFPNNDILVWLYMIMVKKKKRITSDLIALEYFIFTFDFLVSSLGSCDCSSGSSASSIIWIVDTGFFWVFYLISVHTYI